MAPGRRSALSAAILVGVLVLPASGVTQDQAACTLIRDLVVVDLDKVKHRHILSHVYAARRKGHCVSCTFSARRDPRIAANR
jgi:hypothetical protein